MKITYIHHSSFLVETEENYFLFDYFEGKLPQLKEDKPLLVFASHRHGDHFSPVIFDLVKTHASTGFVLSDDIWKRRVPEELMGKTYFIGPEEELDLHNWVWEGEPEADNKRMSQRFHQELEKLRGIHIDVAFMLLDPRQEKDFYLGMDDFMRMVGADVVFPMHFWGDFEVTDRFKVLECAKDYKDRIVKISTTGESFEI